MVDLGLWAWYTGGFNCIGNILFLRLDYLWSHVDYFYYIITYVHYSFYIIICVIYYMYYSILVA